VDYLQVKNIEKYHPGYADRNLIWCKVYFNILNSEPEFEMIEEIDKWRFIAFIILQLQLKKPIPINEDYLKRKGFDLKKRPISLTLKMLHNFVTLRKQLDPPPQKPCSVEIEVDKDIELYIDKDKEHVTDFFNYFSLKTKTKLKLDSTRSAIIRKRLTDHSLEELKRAVDNFILDEWVDRKKFIDIVYCIGIRNKIDNLERWLNYKPKPKVGTVRGGKVFYE